MIDLARAGVVERPDGDGRAGGGSCDDRVRITLRLDGERLAAVRFGADACASATAAAAWLATATEGRGLLDAARLGLADVLAADPALVPTCALTAVDALHAALGDAVVRGARLAPSPGRVGVAMSGGVDSAAVLLGAVDEGREAVGLTLRLWIDPAAPAPDRACCAPASVRAARDLCHSHGMPHLALDLREAFREAVVAPFVAGYAAGETPNPCATCNGAFRFDALDDAAMRLGCAEWRTGHYARIVERDGALLVARGADPAKDQSAMLALVDPAILRRVRLPLGGSLKRDVVVHAPADRVGASFRVRAEPVPAALELHGDGTALLVLDRDAFQVAPGQVAALYDGDCIVAAGVVDG